jgi:uncharacterized protein
MTDEFKLYRTYSKHLQGRYGEKTYKIPIHLPAGCPNRDGSLGVGGCDFCAEDGTGFEMLSESIPVRCQLEQNMAYIGKRYQAKKFIAYFQNYTNTYLPQTVFEQAINNVIHPQVVEIAISTRPDCLDEKQLIFLDNIRRIHQVNITIELGLQTANYRTLYANNRGHGLASFIDAVLRIQKYGFDICAHLILNLPGDDDLDAIETARILSALKIQQVKLHALYIMNDTKMGHDYETGKFQMISVEAYQERVILFLENLDPNIIIQRLIGRAPEKNSLFVNWNMSWWKIRDQIHDIMEQENRYQGVKFGIDFNMVKSQCI